MKLCSWRPIFWMLLLHFYLFFHGKEENNLCFNWQITIVRRSVSSFRQIWRSSYVDHLAISCIPPFLGIINIFFCPLQFHKKHFFMSHETDFIHFNMLDNILEIVCVCVCTCVYTLLLIIIVSKLVLKSDFAISLQYFV